MAERTDLFADIVLPLALPNLFTYRIPQSMSGSVVPGMRVVVQFGKSKLYAAVVWKVHENAPQYAAKYIEHILDPEPVVTEKQLELWEWMSAYYLCTRGEILIAALPSGLRLTSETRILLNPGHIESREGLSDEEFVVLEALDVRQTLTLEELSAILDRKTVYPLVKELIAKGFIRVHEELQERYRPKFENFIRLADAFNHEDKLREAFDELEKRAFRQLEVLMTFIRLSDRYAQPKEFVKRTQLLEAAKDSSGGALRGLITRGILEQHEIEVSRLLRAESEGRTILLSDEQQQALQEIRTQFESLDVVLLHGVTSSGKTEVYIRLIAEQLEQHKQVLYLLPEIALTTQLIVRLQKHFGEKVFVYHSKYSEQERVEVWQHVRKGGPVVVIGARSSLFLPFEKPGLIIVDEEHDSSYKQHEPAPRYNARETAIWLARLHGAKVLLGSATPSVETYFLAKQGRYGFALLTGRFGGTELPHIEVVDTKELARKKLMQSHFSPQLVEGIQQTLDRGEQVILFQNRRGFAPSIECQSCGHVPHCIRCDVSLTYHKVSDQLRCHYCGWTTPPPKQCEACGDTDLRMRGFGTEKIEEELALIFPTARIARMDLDTTRGKNSLHQLVADFENRKIDMLVGTQMVTKGLDFGHVALVGILHADQLLNFPDFRAWERSFQLMAQVAGRAGRRSKQGRVIIQTFNTRHPVIEQVVAHDYIGLYQQQIAERQEFSYPPFHRLIRLTLKCKDEHLLITAAQHLADQLRAYFGGRVLGPEFPAVGRIRDEYLKNIMLKIEREANSVKVKQIIANELLNMRAHPDYKKVRVVADVDPV
ncbi:MAG: primosomal protein N' [Bacteroidia bacterium]|jgi:primosomal protein N' (replication factor Y)|nr:primosomal protein N' [Bacteroidia bacterium]